MSTKKTREALDLMKEIQGYSTADIHDAAIKEVEAIEKAARAMNDATLDRMKLRETALLMKSIAKDAP